jgi:hypothetical protein
MKIYFYDGGVLSCSEIEFGADGLIADGYRLIPLNEITRITDNPIDESVHSLWAEFGDVPMDPETECIEQPWRGFSAGTHREEIWHWFEDTFGVSVHDLMYE